GATMKGGWPDHERGTIEGTRNVLTACRKHAVGKLVHVSSLSVIDWAGGEVLSPVDEDTPFEGRAEERGAYTRAKLEAEKLVAAEAARRVGGRHLVLGDGEILLPLVYIDDVVDSLLLAAKNGIHTGEVIQIVDPE